MARVGRPPSDPLERLLGKTVENAAGCWEWQGYRDRDGYGTFWFDGKQRRAHRVAYQLLVGPVEAPQLDHLCRNRRCVNPAHLEPVTNLENHRSRRLCDCGTCRRCKHRDYMRDYYHRRKATGDDLRAPGITCPATSAEPPYTANRSRIRPLPERADA